MTTTTGNLYFWKRVTEGSFHMEMSSNGCQMAVEDLRDTSFWYQCKSMNFIDFYFGVKAVLK
jgi:hypothetical protein